MPAPISLYNELHRIQQQLRNWEGLSDSWVNKERKKLFKREKQLQVAIDKIERKSNPRNVRIPCKAIRISNRGIVIER